MVTANRKLLGGQINPLPNAACLRVSGSSLMALIALITLMFSTVSTAAVYRWVDEEGITHFADRRVPEATKISITRLSKKKIPDTFDWNGPLDPEFLAMVEQQCAVSKDRLAVYRSAGEVYVRDSDGPSRPMPRSETRDLISDLKSSVEKYCSPGAGQRLHAEMIAARREALKNKEENQ